ncbi:collagen alpha-1(I) chain-like [Cavia porcellus]|uniref:collagen alpha-1(I) chain-like n=1 Tax=Cavia porcellus TaxID=10141 RepID=UPI000661D347|nr:collagen alpha-2(I) chain-like [Cavia porcellus]
MSLLPWEAAGGRGSGGAQPSPGPVCCWPHLGTDEMAARKEPGHLPGVASSLALSALASDSFPNSPAGSRHLLLAHPPAKEASGGPGGGGGWVPVHRLPGRAARGQQGSANPDTSSPGACDLEGSGVRRELGLRGGAEEGQTQRCPEPGAQPAAREETGGGRGPKTSEPEANTDGRTPLPPAGVRVQDHTDSQIRPFNRL